MSRPDPKIAYEPHPVSPARKKELREQGFTIVDAIYKPKVAPAEPPAEERSTGKTAKADKAPKAEKPAK